MSDKSIVQPLASLALHSRVSRRTFLGASSCALGGVLATRLFADQDVDSNTRNKAVESARSVLNRILGSRSSEFELASTPAENRHQVYEVSALNGRVRVTGSSAVAICRGAYTYLRESCNSMITWSGQHLELPSIFPNLSMRRVVCPYEYVQYYNVCTFGYSTAFWNWERWQRELDWMALHGITMALAMEGQEAIWQRVWLQMGVSQAELGRYFTGPAQLPWHRMGNISNFDGPLPVDWIEQNKTLQHKILGRMRDLGISPIVPGFSGFVPQGFKRVHPEVKAYTELWNKGMSSLSKTFILDPGATNLYEEIGKRFIQEYKQEFGPARYYLADTFNEMAVPVSNDHRYEDLARFAHAVFKGIVAGDPDGVWVMQGWLFYADPKFWDDASVKAYLSSIPNDRMIILDYSNDSNARRKDAYLDPTYQNEWKQHKAFYGKQWINGMAHTLGGNNNVKGNLALIAAQPATVVESPAKGNLIGWSMNPEGIETNEVVYELMTDIGWHAERINLDSWIVDYCRARYGACPAAMKEAWVLLRQSAYGWGMWTSRQAWQCRPTLEPAAINVDSGPIFRQAVGYFLLCSDPLMSSELYRNDLIELVAQSVGGSVDKRLREACDAHKSGRYNERNRKSSEALNMLTRVDGLMNVRVDRRLEKWTEEARSWGATSDVRAYYDENARRLITSWGWPDLDDYASRVWSGLIRDYYVGRWRAFFQSLQENRTPDINILEQTWLWEQSWLSTPYRPSVPVQVDDIAAEAKRMLDACSQWS